MGTEDDHLQPGEVIPAGAATLTIEQLAGMLRLDRRTVERRVSAGQIPGSFRLGGARRFVRAVVEKWISEGCPPVARRRDQR
jgi:excisionase family DNA binding protein